MAPARRPSPAANTYSGATTVNAGTLQAGSTQAFGVNSDTAVGGGATLVLDGNSNTIGNLNDAGTVENANVAAATLTVGGGDATGGSFSGVISDGSGGGALSLTKSGAGTQTLSGTNTYTGTTTVSAGTLQAGSTQAFGVNSDTTVAGSAVLLLDGFSNTIGNLDGAGSVVGDNDTATAATLTVGGGDATGGDFSGVISDGSGGGALSLTKIGTGTQTLSGANTYTGATTVNAGILTLEHDSALGGSGTGTTVSSGAQLQLDQGVTIASEALTISGDGVGGTGALRGNTSNGNVEYGGDITLAANSKIFAGGPGTMTVSGTVDGAGNQLTLENGSPTISVTGAITGASTSLVKAGTGTATLSGTNDYTGATTVSAGTLQLGVAGTGSITSATTVNTGATLAGTGTSTAAVTVASGGTLAPGDTGGAAIGVLTSNADLTIAAGGTLSVQIDEAFSGAGPVAGTDYDQVDVTGTVDITGSTLNVGSINSGSAFTPNYAEVFTIINNDSTDTVTGAFSGLAAGDVATTIDGVDMKIYYDGESDFNDVVLVSASGTATDLYVNDQWTAAATVDGNQETAGVENCLRRGGCFCQHHGCLRGHERNL